MYAEQARQMSDRKINFTTMWAEVSELIFNTAHKFEYECMFKIHRNGAENRVAIVKKLLEYGFSVKLLSTDNADYPYNLVISW